MSTIDLEFARLHDLSVEGLEVLLELFPRITGCMDHSSFSHPPSSMLGSESVENCYRLRLEAAEKRYARMKGLVTVSLEAQHQLKSENTILHAAQAIVQQGLERDCAVTLKVMLSSKGKMDAVASEINSLTTRLRDALVENEKLMTFNRELRGETMVPMVVDDASSGVAVQNDPEENAEISTLRARITALELECCRLQSRPELFDDGERLRECEDVFDQLLGRDRLDNCVEDVPGSSLLRFHPVGTCSSVSCKAYALRLRGGLRRAVTDAYARERNERINGFVKHYVRPAVAICAEKDLEIRQLNERIARFEQTMRMTSGEADQVQLHVVSSEIVEAMTELGRLRSECARLRMDCSKLNSVLVVLDSQERAVSARLGEVLVEVNSLLEERALTQSSRDMLAEERHRLETVREEILKFKDGRMGSAFKEKKAQIEALQREMDGLSVNVQPTDVEDPVAMSAVESPVEELQSNVELRKKKSKRSSQFDILPNGGGVRLLCRCGERVLISEIADHAQQDHRVPEKRVLVCKAGCGYFVTNGSRVDMDKHTRSNSCVQRLAEIHALV
jgi:hypothetical protein